MTTIDAPHSLRIRIPAFEEEEDDEFVLPDWHEYPEAATKDTVHAMDAEYIIRMVTLSDTCRTLKRRAIIGAAIFRFLYYRPALFSYPEFRTMVQEKVNEYRCLIARGCFSLVLAKHIDWECQRVELSMGWSTTELAE
jgi:hypothetical protein